MVDTHAHATAVEGPEGSGWSLRLLSCCAPWCLWHTQNALTDVENARNAPISDINAVPLNRALACALPSRQLEWLAVRPACGQHSCGRVEVGCGMFHTAHQGAQAAPSSSEQAAGAAGVWNVCRQSAHPLAAPGVRQAPQGVKPIGGWSGHWRGRRCTWERRQWVHLSRVN